MTRDDYCDRLAHAQGLRGMSPNGHTVYLPPERTRAGHLRSGVPLLAVTHWVTYRHVCAWGMSPHVRVVRLPALVAYQDECGDLYCVTHRSYAGGPSPLRGYTRGELESWTSRDLHCDYCGRGFRTANSRQAE